MGDQVAAGAFRTKSLAERRPLLLWMHDPAEPVGVWEVVRETAQGLYVKGKLILETRPRPGGVCAAARPGPWTVCSIGFRTLKSMRTKTGRLLQELQLEEISLVTIPALASARVTSVKSNAGQRSIPEKEPSMSLELSVPEDDAAETAAAHCRPRCSSGSKRSRPRRRRSPMWLPGSTGSRPGLSRPSARVEVREDQAQLETKAFANWCRRGWEGSERYRAEGAGRWHRRLARSERLADHARDLLDRADPQPGRCSARCGRSPGCRLSAVVRCLFRRGPARLTAGWVAETIEHAVSEPAYIQLSVGLFEARVTTEVVKRAAGGSAVQHRRRAGPGFRPRNLPGWKALRS